MTIVFGSLSGRFFSHMALLIHNRKPARDDRGFSCSKTHEILRIGVARTLQHVCDTFFFPHV